MSQEQASAGAAKRSGLPKSLVLIAAVLLIGAFVAWAVSSNSQEIGGMKLFALAVAAAFVIQWIAFIPANLWKTEKFFDLLGGSTYFTLTLLLLILVPEKNTRTVVIAVFVMIWSARLATFLFRRVRKSGKDGRFDVIKQNPVRFFNVWNIQGLWVTFTAAAAWAGITSLENASGSGVDAFLIVGAILWVVGFGIEITADSQKSAFRARPENKDAFITTGLWSISRHPNYLGEIMLWLGVAVIAFPTLSGWGYVALFSPVFVFILLNFVSGVPLLEKRADEKWGGQEAYEQYKKSTPVLFPNFSKKNSH